MFSVVRFHTLSGVLEVTKGLEMGLPLAVPSDPVPEGCEDPEGSLAMACTGGLEVRGTRMPTHLKFHAPVTQQSTLPQYPDPSFLPRPAWSARVEAKHLPCRQRCPSSTGHYSPI